MGKPAARVGDATAHGSPMTGACALKTLIGGKPAWRVGDQHICFTPSPTGAPHGPGGALPVPDGGEGICLIEGKLAARVGDIVLEPGGIPPMNSITTGAMNVLIGMGGGAGIMSGATSPDGRKDNC